MSPALAHIVDDDEAIRDALTWLFQSRGVAAAAWPSGEAFLGAWRPDLAGCLVLDIRMDGLSGLQVFDLLKEKGSRLPTIFLTGHGDVPLAVAALKKGAHDFLEKPFDDNELVDRVIAALAFEAQQRQDQDREAGVSQRLTQLTSREKQVMDRILAGKMNKVIADELDIAMRTVEVHRSRIFEKMGVKSAVELAGLLSGKK